MRVRVLGLAAVVVLLAQSATAQEVSRSAAETVVSTQAQNAWDHPTLMFDGTSTTRLSTGLVGIVRPWAWRRPDGTWTAAWYQMQLRYERRAAGIGWRVDGGIITSPLGLAAVDLRADVNPTLSPPFYYVAPLPRFDVRFDGLQMMSGGYPLGAIVTASGARWDLRGGITDSTPARPQSELKSGSWPSFAQAVVGGGFTPRAGLRVGAGFAEGRYRSTTASPVAGVFVPAASATVFNLEGEYTVRYTRLSGEWVRNVFDTTGSPARATASYAQIVQTLTARVFAAARRTAASAPLPLGNASARRTQVVYELTAGFRATPDWTIRTGWSAQRTFVSNTFNQQVGVSLVWAHRWR